MNNSTKILEIFAWALSNDFSYRQISIHLNSQNIQNLSGRFFTVDVVRAYLKYLRQPLKHRKTKIVQALLNSKEAGLLSDEQVSTLINYKKRLAS